MKLTVSIDRDWQESVRGDVMRAFAAEQVGELLTFASPELFFARLKPNRWALVQLLQRQGPSRVREIARQANRDARRVHDDLKVLLDLGLIEKDENGKIFCPYSDYPY